MKNHIHVIWLVILLFSGCQTMNGARVPAENTRRGMMVSEEDELEMSKQINKEVREKYKVTTNEKLAAYVTQIGRGVAKRSKQNGLQYTFTVLEDDRVSELAVPDGHIYLTTGMLKSLGSEANLAFMLGHSIGHIVEHHMAKETERGIYASLVSVAGSFIFMNGLLALAMYPASNAYSAANEVRADQLGIVYAARCGYDLRDDLDNLFRGWTIVNKYGESIQMPVLEGYPQMGRRRRQGARLAWATDIVSDTSIEPGEFPRLSRDEYWKRISGQTRGEISPRVARGARGFIQSVADLNLDKCFDYFHSEYKRPISFRTNFLNDMQWAHYEWPRISNRTIEEKTLRVRVFNPELAIVSFDGLVTDTAMVTATMRSVHEEWIMKPEGGEWKIWRLITARHKDIKARDAS